MYTTSPPYHGTPVHRTALLPTGEVVPFHTLHVTESPHTVEVQVGGSGSGTTSTYWYCGVQDGYAYYTLDQQYTTCELCGHPLLDNLHGFDQGDSYVDGNGDLTHSGRCMGCTYCKVCAAVPPTLPDQTDTVLNNTTPTLGDM